MKLFIDPADLKAQYAASPAWLKALMDAWADGLNYYLAHAPDGEAAGHHAVRAVDGAQLQRGQHRRRHREGARSAQLEAFYGKAPGAPRRRRGRRATAPRRAEPTGSNGIAIAPSNTASTATRCC